MRPAARGSRVALCACLCLPLLRAAAQSDATPARSAGEYLQRVEAALLLQTLNADLLSHDSASLTLERWCSTHQLASPARISAERVHDADKPLGEGERQRLRLTASDEVRYRRVRLRCGAVTLSEADNWYVPARLTPQMNELLERTDTPFGIVVQPLRFQRHTIAAELLWQPLPVGWEMSSAATPLPDGALCLPGYVLQHRALLTVSDGTPFSEVVETYSRNVLAVPRLAPVPSC